MISKTEYCAVVEPLRNYRTESKSNEDPHNNPKKIRLNKIVLVVDEDYFF